MNTIFKLIVVMLVLSQSVAANDFKKIYNRMYNEYLNNPSKSSVESILKKMNSNGSFTDINYAAKDGSPRKHIQNLIALAGAYENPENAFYAKDEVRSAYLRSLNFWVETDNQATNWWYRYIPYPKELSRGIILMTNEIKRDKALFDKTIKYLQWSYDTAKPSHMTGANLADIIMGSIAASILTENDKQMMIYKSKMTEFSEPLAGQTQVTVNFNEGEPVYFGIKSKSDTTALKKVKKNDWVTFLKTENELQMKFSETETTEFVVKIHNTSGQLVFNKRMNEATQTLNITTTAFQRGLLICSLSNGKNTKSFKWIN